MRFHDFHIPSRISFLSSILVLYVFFFFSFSAPTAHHKNTHVKMKTPFAFSSRGEKLKRQKPQNKNNQPKTPYYLRTRLFQDYIRSALFPPSFHWPTSTYIQASAAKRALFFFLAGFVLAKETPKEQKEKEHKIKSSLVTDHKMKLSFFPLSTNPQLFGIEL